MDAQIPFVATKLSRPVTSARELCRPRLTTVLSNILTCRLLLVCAGPGYGKTTLLARLVDTGYPLVWYSLGAMDRDLPVFLSHLLAGIARHQVEFGQFLREKLESAQVASKKDADFALRALVNELAEKIDKDIIVVLDDYHLVEKSRIINYAIEYLLTYMPAYVHLAIASRSAPQFACLPRLATAGQAFTIEEADLEFTPDEVASLFAQTFASPLDPATLMTVCKQTEGWAIALKLIGQSCRASRTKAELEAWLPMRKDTLFSYFSEEVLNKQPRAIQTFLLDSSVFSHLNADVCDAVLGRSDAAKVLSWLEKNGLFLTRLDDKWYRYHHLFQAFLYDRLSLNAERKRELHQQAATFFEKNCDEEQSVRHYLHAEEYGRAAALISRLSEELFRTGRFESLSHFVNDLPREVSGKFPDLSMWVGKALELQGRFEEALSRYESAEVLYKRASNSIGLSRTLRGKGNVLIWAQAEPDEAEVLHRQALDYLGGASRIERAAILSGLALDMICAGNSSAALEFYNEALHIYVEEADELGEMRTLTNQGWVVFSSRGEFTEVLRLMARAEHLAIKLEDRQDLAECYRGRASALLFMGEHAQAAATAEKLIELARQLDDKHKEAWGLVILGQTIDDMRINDDALVVERFRQAYDIAEECGSRRVSVLALTGLANHHRRKGNLPEAKRLARRALESMGNASDQWLRGFVLRYLGMVELAQNPQLALQMLTEAQLVFAKCEDKYNLTHTHLWLATVYEARGERDDERYHLQKCLELAVANEYFAPFITEPEIASRMLRDALSWGLSTQFVRDLLARTGPAGIQAVLSLLVDGDVDIKLQAIACLAEIGGAKVTRHLRELVKDRDEGIRHAAEQALDRIAHGPGEPLTVCLLGRMSVLRGESAIDASAWKRKKAKAFLAFLALQKGRAAHKDVIIDKLWPEADWQTALNQLNSAVYDLRQALEPEREEVAQSRYVLYRDGRYHLSLGPDGRVDVELFEKGLQSASFESDADRTISRLEEVVGLYGGELLHDMLEEEWCQAERERLQELYLSGLQRLGDLHERKGDFDAAIARFKQILSIDSCREDIQRALIDTYVKMGNRTEAIRQYRACVRALHEELGVPPEESTKLSYLRAVRSPH